LLASFLYILNGYRHGGSPKKTIIAYTAPNCLGKFTPALSFGLACIGAYALDAFVGATTDQRIFHTPIKDKSWKRTRNLIAIFIGVGLASAINPYGLDAVLYWIKKVSG